MRSDPLPIARGVGRATALGAVAVLAACSAFPPALAAVQPAPVRSAGVGAPGAPPEAIAAGRAILAALVREANLPGLQVAVGRDGEIAWSEGFGWADLERRVAVTPLTRFRIGSVGKTLTAAAAARLHEEGRLDLDAPIAPHVPSFPDKGAPITARQLAGHLAGIRHYRDDEPRARSEEYADVVETLEIFAADSLLHPPGSAFEYSTYGYTLLSAVLQAAGGGPFLELMRDRVFRPLGMRRTVADHVDSIVPHRAAFYEESREDGRLVNAPFTNNSYKWAGGGYLSTAEDLVRFASGLAAGRLVSAAMVDAIFTPMTTAAGEGTGYGMGWRPRTDREGRPVVRHGGSSVGGRAFLILWPDHGLAIALLVNAGSAPVFHQEAQTLAHFFLDHPEAGEGTPAEAGGARSGPDERAGRPGTTPGTYRFTSRRGDEEVAGTLTLTGSAAHPGWMRWEGAAAPVPIVLVDRHGEETRLIGAGVHGLLNVWARFDEEGFAGRWDWLGRTSEIRGRPDGSAAEVP